jgi:hypothetical protein
MTVDVCAIDDAQMPAVGRFLNKHLNQRVPAEAWVRAVQVPWKVDAPNYGFLLRDERRVVGAYLAFYSERMIDGAREEFCNLGAWCVLPDYRLHSLRLLKALLAQDGYSFTDLSPSGTVVPLNERLKFRFLDTSTAMLPGLPWPSVPGRVKIVTDPAVIERSLSGRELEIYHDHADAAGARHVLIRRGDASCYVIFRKDRRKNIPVFASILHVSDVETFQATAPILTRHLLVQHGVLVTLAEPRVVGRRPRLSITLKQPRRKMYKSSHLEPDQIDYLYSELVCVGW